MRMYPALCLMSSSRKDRQSLMKKNHIRQIICDPNSRAGMGQGEGVKQYFTFSGQGRVPSTARPSLLGLADVSSSSLALLTGASRTPSWGLGTCTDHHKCLSLCCKLALWRQWKSQSRSSRLSIPKSADLYLHNQTEQYRDTQLAHPHKIKL